MLSFFSSGVVAASYPVALGRPTWRTPQGDFTVGETRADPIWTVPKSIQREMAQQGKEVKTKVAPGPDNPLGGYWIGLSMPALGIHGTTAPRSIYRFARHGCIRLHPADAAKLFPMVKVGTPVRIIYEPVLLAHLDDGRIFVEANPDIYGLAPHALDDLQALAVSSHISNMIDWQRMQEALERKDGLARDVTIRGATPILSPGLFAQGGLDRFGRRRFDHPPQPPYLQPHLWGLSCRLELRLFFDQIVESTRIIFGSRLAK